MTTLSSPRIKKSIHGILLLNKPIKWSSNGVLQRVKRLFQAKKAGHTGSLDPLATGMLPICFGEATKFSQFLLDADKIYDVVALLGVQTSTGDGEGEVIAEHSVTHITQEQIKTVLQNFLGEIEQVPPMHSALKHEGQPLYKLARKGVEVERKARTVTIFSIEFVAYDKARLALRVHCSKGTYIRTLVEDIGSALACGAYVVELHRTMVQPYEGAKMYTLEDLEAIANEEGEAGLLACLLPLDTSVKSFPAVQLSASATFCMRTGQSIKSTFPIESHLVRLISDGGQFIGMGEVIAGGTIKPHRLLS